MFFFPFPDHSACFHLFIESESNVGIFMCDTLGTQTEKSWFFLCNLIVNKMLIYPFSESLCFSLPLSLL